MSVTKVLYSFLILALILVTLPFQGVVALLVILTSGFPVLFAQRRMGIHGRPFLMYKFRTMDTDAESWKRKYMHLNESKGPVFKIHNDPRFVGIGKFLSHTGIDELPQLWNVLHGDMALIGPRPLPMSEAKKLESWMLERHSVIPGIISPAILTGKYHKNFDAWMKSDIAYVRSKSAGTDIPLFFNFFRFLILLLLREFKRKT